MPYSRSNERLSAEARLGELQRCYAFAKMRPKSLPSNIREAIYCNCVFQLVGSLEDYLSNRMADWIFKVRSSQSTFDRLPVILRYYLLAESLVPAFRSHVATDDDKRLVGHLDSSVASLRMALGSEIVSDEDQFNALISKRKFPSHKNFEHLFASLGVIDINRRLSRRIGRTNFRLALKSLVDVRNAIAHESPPAITDVDVVRYIRDMKKWISAIDRELYSHIVKSSGAQFW